MRVVDEELAGPNAGCIPFEAVILSGPGLPARAYFA
jgi:hypothetical protein